MQLNGYCGHCGMMHGTQPCPRIKAIEYHENGTVKRVEYWPQTGSFEDFRVSVDHRTRAHKGVSKEG